MRKIKNKLSILFFLFSSIVSAGFVFPAVPPIINPVDIYAVSSGSPAGIAAGTEGKIYVTDPMNGLVNVFSNNGLSLGSLHSGSSPLGITADQTGNLYVSDLKDKNVGIYDPNGNFILKLGSGDGEFVFPNYMAVSGAGKVYVTDSKANMVKIYSTLNGVQAGSFGAGLLNFPTGIAVDDNTGEVFVIDHNNLYVRVYGLTGNLIRSIRFNTSALSNKILAPLGIALDSTRIYVTDAFHSVIAVFDRGNGAFLKYI